MGLVRTDSVLDLPVVRNYFYGPQRTCGQGYVFTRVCDSVHGGSPGRENPPEQADTPGTRQTPPGPGRQTPPAGRTPPDQAGRTPPDQAGIPPLDQADPPRPGRPPPPPPDQAGRSPPGSRLQHTVNERPVRILLECILVLKYIFGGHKSPFWAFGDVCPFITRVDH